VISAFLAHPENDRGNSPATRNGRLAAIHSMFAYIALHYPEHAATAQRVLAIPAKRTRRAIVTYLTAAEADAVLAACDQQTWAGRRDHAGCAYPRICVFSSKGALLMRRILAAQINGRLGCPTGNRLSLGRMTDGCPRSSADEAAMFQSACRSRQGLRTEQVI
jgi:hypothetical protein